MYMKKEDFRQALRKYLDGRATEDERALIDRWYQRMDADGDPFKNREEEHETELRYWSRIRAYLRSDASQRHWWRWSLAVAALLALVYFNKAGELPAHTSEPFVTDAELFANNTDSLEHQILPDGSIVVLEPRSELRIAADFGSIHRKVYLSGKAFFEVVPDESKPFAVVTNEVITRVVGTSFTVSAFAWENDVKVAVVSGKVTVFKREGVNEELAASGVVLTPNQEFVYRKAEQKVLTTIVEEPQIIIPVEEVKRLRFEETSSIEVFKEIERVYGVEISVDEERFSECRITTSISEGSIFSRLRIICEVINATYRVEETRIIIEGEGCYSQDTLP